MEAKSSLRNRLPGRRVTEGSASILHGLYYYYAMGLIDVAEIFRKTLYVADLKPAGRFIAKDLFETDDIPLLMKALLDNGFLHGECGTVAGCSMAKNLLRVDWSPDQEIVCPANAPLTAADGVVGLRGNRSSDGAPVKAACAESWKFTGPALPLGEEELQERQEARRPREMASGSRYLWKYAQQAGGRASWRDDLPGRSG